MPELQRKRRISPTNHTHDDSRALKIQRGSFTTPQDALSYPIFSTSTSIQGHGFEQDKKTGQEYQLFQDAQPAETVHKDTTIQGAVHPKTTHQQSASDWDEESDGDHSTSRSPNTTSSDRVRPVSNASRNITFEMLRRHFDRPLKEAASHYGVCTTHLKKICRKNGIANWPYRQIIGLKKSIASMLHQVEYFEGEQRYRYRDQLRKLELRLEAYVTTGQGLIENQEALNGWPTQHISSHHVVAPGDSESSTSRSMQVLFPSERHSSSYPHSQVSNQTRLLSPLRPINSTRNMLPSLASILNRQQGVHSHPQFYTSPSQTCRNQSFPQ